MESLSKAELYIAVTAAVTAGATSYYTYSKVSALSNELGELKGDVDMAISRADEISTVRAQVVSLTRDVQTVPGIMNKLMDMESKLVQQGHLIGQLQQIMVSNGLDMSSYVAPPLQSQSGYSSYAVVAPQQSYSQPQAQQQQSYSQPQAQQQQSYSQPQAQQQQSYSQPQMQQQQNYSQPQVQPQMQQPQVQQQQNHSQPQVQQQNHPQPQVQQVQQQNYPQPIQVQQQNHSQPIQVQQQNYVQPNGYDAQRQGY